MFEVDYYEELYKVLGVVTFLEGWKVKFLVKEKFEI